MGAQAEDILYADLSGLNGVGNVIYTELTDGANTFRQVQIPVNIKLVINGSLTIDSSTDQLLFPHTSNTFIWLEVNAGGILKIKDTSTDGTTVNSYQKVAIRSLARTANHFSTNQGGIINDNGTLEMDGGAIYCNSHINFRGGNSKLKIISPSVIRLGIAENGLKNILRTSSSRADFDINGLILQESTSGIEQADIIKLDNYSPQFCAEGLLVYGGSNSGQITLNNYNPIGCDMDFAFISSGSFYTVYGYPNKDVTATVHFDHGSASGGGWVKIRKKLEITSFDEQNNPIEDVVTYFQDIDNGSRYNKKEDLTATITYTSSSNNLGVSNFDVLLANVQVNNGESTGRNSSARTVDYRTKNNDFNYRLDLKLFAYNYQYKLLSDVDFTGLETTNYLSTVLLKDALITESNKIIIDAYEEIDTPLKLYDKAKSYLVDNYAGESLTYVTRVENTIDARNYNVVLDPTAPTAFTINNDTITIKVTSFEGNITTTKEVRLLNGASVKGGIIDVNGDSFLTYNFIDSWRVYSSINDRDSNNNELGAGTNTENYRFVFNSGTTYYLRLVSNGVTFFRDYTPSQPGETLVDLSIQALLASQATKEQIAEEVHTYGNDNTLDSKGNKKERTLSGSLFE